MGDWNADRLADEAAKGGPPALRLVDLSEARLKREASTIHQLNCLCQSCMAKHAPETHRVLTQWIERQSWWKSDIAMIGAAVYYHGHLNETKPHLSIRENLAEVEVFLAREFPDKFRVAATTA